jgi:hypothetical protein
MTTNTTTPTYSSNLDDLEPVDATTSAAHGAAASVGPDHPCVIAPAAGSRFTTAVPFEVLRTFAVAHGEMAFAHLCTAAINGETWAIDRLNGTAVVAAVLRTFRAVEASGEQLTEAQREGAISLLRDVDTSRTDGAIARSFVMP